MDLQGFQIGLQNVCERSLTDAQLTTGHQEKTTSYFLLRPSQALSSVEKITSCTLSQGKTLPNLAKVTPLEPESVQM